MAIRRINHGNASKADYAIVYQNWESFEQHVDLFAITDIGEARSIQDILNKDYVDSPNRLKPALFIRVEFIRGG